MRVNFIHINIIEDERPYSMFWDRNDKPEWRIINHNHDRIDCGHTHCTKFEEHRQTNGLAACIPNKRREKKEYERERRDDQ